MGGSEGDDPRSSSCPSAVEASERAGDPGRLAQTFPIPSSCANAPGGWESGVDIGDVVSGLIWGRRSGVCFYVGHLQLSLLTKA